MGFIQGLFVRSSKEIFKFQLPDQQSTTVLLMGLMNFYHIFFFLSTVCTQRERDVALNISVI